MRCQAIHLLFVAALMIVRPAASKAVCAGCRAEQITAATANQLLFGGTDATGGIDDWYLSNGKIEAIIDDIGSVETGVAGVTADKTSSNAVETGGTLIDLGMNGKDNDQLPELFNTGGLSLANAFIFRQGDETVWGLPTGNNPCATIGPANALCPLDDPADADCAGLTVYGIMLGPCTSATDLCSTRAVPQLFVRTTYKMCDRQSLLDLRTELWNKSGHTDTLPIFDVFLWGGHGIIPFAADEGRGFTHPLLDLSDVGSVLTALTNAPYFAAPGNVSRHDGIMSREKKANGITYGYLPFGTVVDSNGGEAGGTLFTGSLPFALQSLQSRVFSAATVPLPGANVSNGQSIIYSRRVVLAAQNDVASVVGDARNSESLLSQIDVSTALPLGRVSGRFKPRSRQEGTLTFIRTGGSDLSAVAASLASLNRGVISEVRTRSSFRNVLLPSGTYAVHAVFPGRDDIVVTGVSVTAGERTTIPSIGLPRLGKLKMQVRDADTNQAIPAKISLSPSPGTGREFAAFEFDPRTGECSNDLTVTCTTDAECGGGNTCFRTCTNVAPQPCGAGCPVGFVCASDDKCRSHACDADSDCTAGYLCRADTVNVLPESFAGGTAQLQVIYTDKRGKLKTELPPGTYTVSVSRGIEYTIQKIDQVVIEERKTTRISTVGLRRVVDTDGYVSADLHVHSGRSLDASAPLEARVQSFAGEGVEVMISTDHDINTDYAPIIRKTRLRSFLNSIIGTEVTTSVSRPPYMANAWGHLSSWPSIYDADERRGGAIEDEGVALNVVLDRLRATSDSQCEGGKHNGNACPPSPCPGGTCTDVGEQVVQLNHPESGVAAGVVGTGLLRNIGYDPARAVTDCQQYPVLCSTSQCAGGTNDGTSCTGSATCTGGGHCGCVGGFLPPTSTGCNDILNDRNVVPQGTRCTNAGCFGTFGNPNGTRNIDFDVMEISDGASVSGFEELRRARRDWLSFLNQALPVGKVGAQHPVWATGGSNSHRVVAELPGYARTYVGAGNSPAPAPISVQSFNQQVLAGNMLVTSGPYIQFTIDQGGTPAKLGETLSATGAVNLNITVQAAPWIPVDEVRIIKNGCVLDCFNSSTTPAVTANPVDPYDQSTGPVVRFNATVADTVTEDSYYLVEASPNLPASGTPPTVDPIVNSVAENNFPFAFTNPIFADPDGGGYTGITLIAGAGEPLCPALPPSCSAGAAIAATATSTMYAAATPGSFTGLLARVLAFVLPTATAQDQRPAAADDGARLRAREEHLRNSAADAGAWRRVVFPRRQPALMAPSPPQ